MLCTGLSGYIYRSDVHQEPEFRHEILARDALHRPNLVHEQRLSFIMSPYFNTRSPYLLKRILAAVFGVSFAGGPIGYFMPYGQLGIYAGPPIGNFMPDGQLGFIGHAVFAEFHLQATG